MPTQAEIVLDSISPAGDRLLSVAVELPRFILAEVNTHRMLSRSYGSSRAIPAEEMLRRVMEESFIPRYWGKNERGMQAKTPWGELVQYLGNGNEEEEYYSYEKKLGTPEEAWLASRDSAVLFASSFDTAGYHKQLVNRIIEPYSYATGIITATEWDNFFTLRLHPDAQPEFQELAQAMKEAIDGSTPRRLEPGQWHLPFIRKEEQADFNKFAWITNKARNWSPIDTEKAVSAARCARISFASNQRGKTFTIEQDLALYDRLFGPPFHAGPFEHQQTPMQYANYNAQYLDLFQKEQVPTDGSILWEPGITHCDRKGNFWCANSKGWIQQRHLL